MGRPKERMGRQTWKPLTSADGQGISDVAQTVASVTSDFATAYHQVSQVIQAQLPTIKATATSLVIGGLVFLSCQGVTRGARRHRLRGARAAPPGAPPNPQPLAPRTPR